MASALKFQGVIALSPESRRAAVLRHVDQQGITVDDGVFHYGAAPTREGVDADAATSTRFPFALVASTSFDLGATLIEPLVAEAVQKGRQTSAVLLVPASSSSSSSGGGGAMGGGLLRGRGPAGGSAAGLPTSAYASLTAMLSSVVRRIDEMEEVTGSFAPDPVVRAAVAVAVAVGAGTAAAVAGRDVAVDVFAATAEDAQRPLASFTELAAAPRQEGWQHWMEACWFADGSGSNNGARQQPPASIVLLNAGAAGGHLLIAVVPVPSPAFLATVVAMQASSVDGLPAVNGAFRGGSPAAQLANAVAASGSSGGGGPPFATFTLDYLRHYFAHPGSGTALVFGVPDLDSSLAPGALRPLEREHTRTLLSAVSALHGEPATTRPPTPPHNPHAPRAGASSSGREPSSEPLTSTSNNNSAGRSRGGSAPRAAGGGVASATASGSALSDTAPFMSPPSLLPTLKLVGRAMSTSPAPQPQAQPQPTATVLAQPAVTGTLQFHSPPASAFGAHSVASPAALQPNSNNGSGVVVVDVDGSQTEMMQHPQPAPRRPSPARAQAEAALAALRAARQSGMNEYGVPTTAAAAQPATDVSPSSVGDSSSSSTASVTDARGDTVAAAAPPSAAAVAAHAQPAARGSSSQGGSSSSHSDMAARQNQARLAAQQPIAGAAIPLPVYGAPRRSDAAASNANDDSGVSGFLTGHGSGSMSSLFEQAERQHQQQQQNHRRGGAAAFVDNSAMSSVAGVALAPTAAAPPASGGGDASRLQRRDSIGGGSEVSATSVDDIILRSRQQQQQLHMDAQSVARLQHVAAVEAELRTVRAERDELGGLLRKMSVRLTRAQDAAQARAAEAAAARARSAELESELQAARDKLEEAHAALKREQHGAAIAGRLARKHALERLEAKCGVESDWRKQPHDGSKSGAEGSASPVPAPASLRKPSPASARVNGPQARTASSGKKHDAIAAADLDRVAALQLANDRLQHELELEREQAGVMRAALLASMEQRENLQRRGAAGLDDLDAAAGQQHQQQPAADPSSVFELVAQSLSRGIDIVSSRHALTAVRQRVPTRRDAAADSNGSGVDDSLVQNPDRDVVADALRKLSTAVERAQGEEMPDVPRVVASEADVLAAKFALTAELRRLGHLDSLILPFGSLLQQTIAAADAVPLLLAGSEGDFDGALQQHEPQLAIRDVPHAATPQHRLKAAAGAATSRSSDASSTTKLSKQSAAQQNVPTAKRSKYIGAGALHPTQAAVKAAHVKR